MGLSQPGVPRSQEATVGENLAFQKREWVFQRLGWVALLLLIVASGVGLLGPGMASRSTSTEPSSGLQIEHYRLVHRQAPVDITARLEQSNAEEQSIWIGAGLLERMTIESMVPEPIRVEADSEGSRFVIATTPGAPASFRLSVRYERCGTAKGRIGRNAAESLDLETFVYP